MTRRASLVEKRSAGMRSLYRNGADQKGLGGSQQAFCNAKMAFVYTDALLAVVVLHLRLYGWIGFGLQKESVQRR